MLMLIHKSLCPRVHHRKDSFLTCKGFVEVGHISRVIRQLRLEFRFQLFVKHLVLVKVGKPRVGEHLPDAIFGSKTLRWVFPAKLRDYVFAIFAHRNVVTVGLELNLFRRYMAEHRGGVFFASIERS